MPTTVEAPTTLRDLVRKIARKSPRLQPEDIVRRVVKNTPEEMIFDFYAEALRPLISDVLRADRNAAVNGTPIRNITPTTNGNGRQPSRSAKVEGIRAIDWDDVFAARVCIAGRWISIGDCSAEELDVYAEELRSHAVSTLAHADFYEDLAKRMRSAGASTARELNPQDLP